MIPEQKQAQLPAGRYLVKCDHIEAYATTRSGKPGPNYRLTFIVASNEYHGHAFCVFLWLAHEAKGQRFASYLDMIGCEYPDGNILDPTNYWQREVWVTIRCTERGFVEILQMEPKVRELPAPRTYGTKHLEASRLRTRELPLADDLPMNKGGFK